MGVYLTSIRNEDVVFHFSGHPPPPIFILKNNSHYIYHYNK